MALSGLAILGLAVQRISRKQGILKSIRESIRRSRRGTSDEFWLELKSQAQKAGALNRAEVIAFYQKSSSGLYAVLEAQLALPARAWSRAEIRQQIEEAEANGQPLMENSLWQRIENVLEYGEAVQFSGTITDAEARQRMEPSLKEVERILASLRPAERKSQS